MAPRRIAREHLAEDLVERGRQRGAPRRGRGDRHGAHALDEGLDVASAEELLSREQLVHDDGRREDVGARVERLAPRLLGRHVRPFAHDALRPVRAAIDRGRGPVGRGARDAEVGDLHLAAPGQQDVRRRDVAVHDPPRVRGVEPLAHLHGHVHGRAHGQAADGTLEEAAEVEPVHVLHGDVQRARVAPEVEDLHDVRVRELDGELGLGDEAMLELGVARQVRQDALDGERLLEAVRAVRLGAEDLGHAAHGDAFEEIVTPRRLFSFWGHAAAIIGPPVRVGDVSTPRRRVDHLWASSSRARASTLPRGARGAPRAGRRRRRGERSRGRRRCCARLAPAAGDRAAGRRRARRPRGAARRDGLGRRLGAPGAPRGPARARGA